MKLRNKAAKLSIVLCVFGSLAIVSFVWRGGQPGGEDPSGMGIFLARPAFAQEGDMSFLEKEVGISAYTNLDQSIDLTAAKTAFRTIEKETNSYIVGSVPVPGYEDTAEEDVHCFVNEDGWIVAYYLRDEPTSKIMYWSGWDGRTISTKVEEGLASIVGAAGQVPTDVKYFHFKYPDANKLMMIADKDTFKITIPSELVVYERSYSINTSSGASLEIDDQRISGRVELISPSLLKPDVYHTIYGQYHYSSIYGGSSGVEDSAIAFVYKES